MSWWRGCAGTTEHNHHRAAQPGAIHQVLVLHENADRCRRRHCVFAVILSVIAIAYSGNAVSRRADVQRLQAENQELADVNHELSRTITEVQARLDDFEERTARLALAAGMQGDASRDRQSESGLHRGRKRWSLRSSPRWARDPETSGTLDRAAARHGGSEALRNRRGSVFDTDHGTRGWRSHRWIRDSKRSLHRAQGLPSRPRHLGATWDSGLRAGRRCGGLCGRNGGLGKTLRISHGFGFTTIYGHLHEITVELGAEVHRGDQIGSVGNTGRSTGSRTSTTRSMRMAKL